MRNKLTRRKVSSVIQYTYGKFRKKIVPRNCFRVGIVFPYQPHPGDEIVLCNLQIYEFDKKFDWQKSEYSTLVEIRFDTEQNKNFFFNAAEVEFMSHLPKRFRLRLQDKKKLRKLLSKYFILCNI